MHFIPNSKIVFFLPWPLLFQQNCINIRHYLLGEVFLLNFAHLLNFVCGIVTAEQM